MLSRFGQSLFGGGGTGVVTAGGVASCSAQAQGAFQTHRHFSGSATGRATAQAAVRKTVRAVTQVAACAAVATGVAAALLKVSGLAAALAVANGHSRVDFSVYGWFTGQAEMQGGMVRIAKPRTLAAKGVASGEGTCQTYQMGYASPAIARATGLGTTYHLAYGLAEASAVFSPGSPLLQIGAYGEALAGASAQALPEYIFGGAGQAIGACAFLGEPALTVAGVRTQFAWGEAVAELFAELTHTHITQSQTGYGRAYLSGRAWYTLGAKGHAIGTASGEAEGIAAATAATAEASGSSATAQGSGLYQASGRGNAGVQAAAIGAGLVTNTKAYGLPAVATGQAQHAVDAVVTNTKAVPDDGYGVAQLKGKAYRTTLAYAHPVALAYAFSGNAVRTHIGYGVAMAQAFGQGQQERTQFVTGHADARSQGEATVEFLVQGAPANCQALGHGDACRTAQAAGVALATATGQGANQVNDLVPAPVSRTIIVPRLSRTVWVQAQPRTIYV